MGPSPRKGGTRGGGGPTGCTNAKLGEAIGGVNSFTGNDPRYDSSMIFLVIDTGNDQLLMMSY